MRIEGGVAEERVCALQSLEGKTSVSGFPKEPQSMNPSKKDYTCMLTNLLHIVLNCPSQSLMNPVKLIRKGSFCTG